VRLLFRSSAPPDGGPAEAAEIDPTDAYDEPRDAPEGRPWVMVDMIASVDGATALDGRSSGLGGAADKAVFRALRTVPDVVLVGAATARVESYGPVRLDESARARRLARGQSALPRLALLSGRLDLDPGSAMFTGSAEPPIVLSTDDAVARHGVRFSDRAELVGLGEGPVDLAAGLRALRDRGATIVLVEGGPSVNGQLVAGGLVDEWCQSTAPVLVSGSSVRVAHGAAPPQPLEMRLHQLLEQDGYLFATWRRTP